MKPISHRKRYKARLVLGIVAQAAVADVMVSLLASCLPNMSIPAAFMVASHTSAWQLNAKARGSLMDSICAPLAFAPDYDDNEINR